MVKMIVKFSDEKQLIFKLYKDKAPETINALEKALPQLTRFLHARFNGEAVFFKADFIEGELPIENTKPGSEMKQGEISVWRGSKGFGGKAIHFWYGSDVAGGTSENVIGEFEGELEDLNNLGIDIWTNGPDKALVVIEK